MAPISVPSPRLGGHGTAWSWFGTNMLGVGLHSYGFMGAAFKWLMIFNASQLALIGLGCLPGRFWKSGKGSAAGDSGPTGAAPMKPQAAQGSSPATA